MVVPSMARVQEEPDEVDPELGATDPQRPLPAGQDHLRIDLVATTSIPGSVFKHRLRLLAGGGWECATSLRADGSPHGRRYSDVSNVFRLTDDVA